MNSPVRFGIFEFDPGSGELRKAGLPIHLSPQPARVLSLLIGSAGQIVTREEFRERIWGSDTYVDFEQGLNHCIRQIRSALCDHAESARFVQTMPRRGYRFLPEVKLAPPGTPGTQPAQTRRPAPRRLTLLGILAACLALILLPGLSRRLLSSGTALPPIESIAVLPLENLSGDPAQEYLADGMTEEIITALGKIPRLRVISRTTVMRYKRTTKPLSHIARELNVDTLLEGTITQSGGRVRLTTNLLQAGNERHIWAESYDRKMDDILSLRYELASTVAAKVRATLRLEERTGIFVDRSSNAVAHDAWLRGRFPRLRMAHGEVPHGEVSFPMAD